jgi:aminoglycoside phosphotransferase (APT) family kinase protein
MSAPVPVAADFQDLVGEAPPQVWDYVRASGLKSLVIGTSKNPNAKVTVLLVSPETGRPRLAIKIPTTEVAARAIEAEARVLLALQGVRLGVMTTTPRVVDILDFDERPAIAMTALEGTPMATSYRRWRSTASSACVTAHFAAVDLWLAQLQRATAGALAPLEMDAGVTSRLASRFSEDEGVADDLEALAVIYARLRRNEVPRVMIHGDFWLGNILLSNGRVSGVVDWEDGGTSGEPVRDVVRFANMYALFLDRRTRPGRQVAGHHGLRAGEWGAGVEYALYGTGWFPHLFRHFLRDCLSRLGASPDSWRDAALAGIAEVAALTDGETFARSHLELFRRLVAREAESS